MQGVHEGYVRIEGNTPALNFPQPPPLNCNSPLNRKRRRLHYDPEDREMQGDASGSNARYPKLNDLTGLIRREDSVAKGGGGYADVYKGVLIDSEQVETHVAIKVIRSHILPENNQNKIYQRLRREIFMWTGLQHPNILPFLGISVDFGPYEAMVCPWMQDGDLNHFLDRFRRALTISERFNILNSISVGLAYLHSKGIIHGDLTSANILMDNGRARLCDFGLSNVLVELQTTSLVTSNVRPGARRWTAPELLSIDDTMPVVTKACDIYSFGGITLHVISGHRPYEDIQRDEQVVVQIFLGRLPPRPTEISNDDCWEFINNCWRRNPNERPDIDVVQQQLCRIQSHYSLRTVNADRRTSTPRRRVLHNRFRKPNSSPAFPGAIHGKADILNADSTTLGVDNLVETSDSSPLIDEILRLREQVQELKQQLRKKDISHAGVSDVVNADATPLPVTLGLGNRIYEMCRHSPMARSSH